MVPKDKKRKFPRKRPRFFEDEYYALDESSDEYHAAREYRDEDI